jgi:CheY-like chemotaxis protein
MGRVFVDELRVGRRSSSPSTTQISALNSQLHAPECLFTKEARRTLDYAPLLLVEDNPKLRPALVSGLEATGALVVCAQSASGEEALRLALEGGRPDAVLMDVQLEGKWNGIEAAVALRREFPRLPIVFYSIQDDEAPYRDFGGRAFCRTTPTFANRIFLLPSMIVPLCRTRFQGRSFIDPTSKRAWNKSRGATKIRRWHF